MQEVLKAKQSNDLMLKKLEALKNEINEQQTHEDGEGSENGGRESKNGSKVNGESHHAVQQHHEELNKTETKNKFNVDPSQHAIFNGIDRENPLLMKRYYQNDCNISAIYNPDYKKTRT